MAIDVTGLADGESEDLIKYDVKRAEGEDKGTYPITVTGDTEQGNYTVTFVDGSFEIKAKEVKVKPAEDQYKIYGDDDPEAFATIVEGLVEGESEELIVRSAARAEGEDKGTYAITVTGEKEQGNYNVTYEEGSFEIKVREITVTAESKTKIYGEDDPELTVTFKNLAERDNGNFDALINYTLKRVDADKADYAGENVGSYRIIFVDENGNEIADEEQNNYHVYFEDGSSVLTITQKDLTLTADSQAKYYSVDDPELTFERTELSKWDEEKYTNDFASLIDYKLEREEGENAGEYAITFSDPKADQNNYNVIFVDAQSKLTIHPIPITLTPSGSKAFGVVDPLYKDVAVACAIDEAAIDSAVACDLTKMNAALTKEIGNNDLVPHFAAKIGFKANAAEEMDRDAGEAIGEYELRFKDQTQTNVNYKAAFAAGVFTITNEIPWAIKLETNMDGEAGITTHTSSIKYTIVPNDGVTLIDNIHGNAVFSVTAVNSEEGMTYPLGTPTADAKDDKLGTIDVNAVAYADGAYGWSSYLPVGTVVTLTATPSKQDEAEGVTVINTITVKSAPTDLKAKVDGNYSVSAGKYTLHEDAKFKLGDVNYIGADDWIIVTVNGVSQTIQFKDQPTFSLEDLKNAFGVAQNDEADWFKTVPNAYITISYVLLDQKHHCASEGGALAKEFSVQFDTGAENSGQTVTNREPAGSVIVLALADTIGGGGNAAADALYGGVAPIIETTEDGKIAWTNPGAWNVEGGFTFPTQGTQFVVTYPDSVGHVVTHTISVTRAAAQTPTSIRIKPMTDETVPSGKIVFYGDGTAHEDLTLVIGGMGFAVTATGGNAAYDINAGGSWTRMIDLSLLEGLPTGVPFEISISYNNLLGKGSTIEVTYKEEALDPVIGGDLIEGSNNIWGFVEPSSELYADVIHADGTVTEIPEENTAVDQFGYFAIRLDEALKAGDKVVIYLMDFCGNEKTVEIDVEEMLVEGAIGELLGMGVMGEVVKDAATGEKGIEHRFATPIDLDVLAADEDKTIELPILAYKSIEIGKVKFVLNDLGKIEVSYEILTPDYIAENGQLRLTTFTEKPSIEALVNNAPQVAVELAEALEGMLAEIDVTAFVSEEGVYSGTIWFNVNCDVSMSESSYISRGGRGVNFYRWLEESLQTEGVLNAVYSETAAYEENVAYYKMYHEFANYTK